MINNLARKLKIINKDTFESAWLKCILDEVPKEKHLQMILKCVNGGSSKISQQDCLRKASRLLQQQQKPLPALKTFYLVHNAEQLVPMLSGKILEHTVSPDPLEQVLQTIALNYYCYLRCQEGVYERMNFIFKMTRCLEVVLLKTDIPIVQKIAKKLLIDFFRTYESITSSHNEYDQQKHLRAGKQFKRFAQLQIHLPLTKEELHHLTHFKILDIPPKHATLKIDVGKANGQNGFRIKTSFNNYTNPSGVEATPIHNLYQTLAPMDDGPVQERKFSGVQCHSNTTRNRFLTPASVRQTAIRKTFYVHEQSPLQFLQYH